MAKDNTPATNKILLIQEVLKNLMRPEWLGEVEYIMPFLQETKTNVDSVIKHRDDFFEILHKSLKAAGGDMEKIDKSKLISEMKSTSKLLNSSILHSTQSLHELITNLIAEAVIQQDILEGNLVIPQEIEAARKEFLADFEKKGVGVTHDNITEYIDADPGEDEEEAEPSLISKKIDEYTGLIAVNGFIRGAALLDESDAHEKIKQIPAEYRNAVAANIALGVCQKMPAILMEIWQQANEPNSKKPKSGYKLPERLADKLDDLNLPKPPTEAEIDELLERMEDCDLKKQLKKSVITQPPVGILKDILQDNLIDFTQDDQYKSLFDDEATRELLGEYTGAFFDYVFEPAETEEVETFKEELLHTRAELEEALTDSKLGKLALKEIDDVFDNLISQVTGKGRS